jgi:hypothetical protein
MGQLVEPGSSLSVVADDPDDNRVLECAVDGSAGFVVSGDHHLLALGKYASILIVTPRRFLDLQLNLER